MTNNMILIGWLVFAGADFQLRPGEKKTVPVKDTQGVVLDNPSVADVHISKGSQAEIIAKLEGDATVTVFSADGKTRTFTLSVEVAKQADDGDDDEDVPLVPVFGGKRITGALCNDPLAGKPMAQALDQARALADRNRLREAIELANQALDEDPRVAVFHLFLGAALAKAKNDARGAYHYETFALSCPEHPSSKAVAQLLRDFHQRGAAASKRAK